MSPSWDREERIKNKLLALQPKRCELINESHDHIGHHESPSGHRDTHYSLTIVSSQFEGVSRIVRHRMINDLLKDEFEMGLHALKIKARAPSEDL